MNHPPTTSSHLVSTGSSDHIGRWTVSNLGDDHNDHFSEESTTTATTQNQSKNHIYSEILEYPNSSTVKNPSGLCRCCCCKYHRHLPVGRLRSVRSSIMAFAILSVMAATITWLFVSVRTMLWMKHPNWPRGEKVQLAFHRNRSFKILQLTDLHYGENPFTDWGPVQDTNTTRLIHSMIQQEQPIDLIIVSGDQITANNINGNATVYYELLCQLLENYTIPYAFIFGNHDDATFEPPEPEDVAVAGTVFNTTLRQELMEYVTHRSTPKSYLSLSQAGPSNIQGVSNYVLNVFNHSVDNADSDTGSDSNNDTKVVLQIMLLDSGGGSINQEIAHNQLRWYQRQRRTVPGDIVEPISYVDAIAFQHIPTKEFRYRTASDATTSSGSGTTGSENPPVCYGTNGENGIAPLQYDASNEIQFLYHNDTSLHFLGVGHNHGNSYCCRSDVNSNTNATTSSPPRVPMHLCFGRHSGYGGYGVWDRGARVYELSLRDDEESFNSRVTWKSWVRFENGTITDVYEPFP